MCFVNIFISQGGGHETSPDNAESRLIGGQIMEVLLNSKLYKLKSIWYHFIIFNCVNLNFVCTNIMREESIAWLA